MDNRVRDPGRQVALRALEAGARGYLPKSMPRKELLDGIRQVHAIRRGIIQL